MIRCKIDLEDIGNTCPVCGHEELDASMDDHRDGEYEDTYKCENCGLAVTYITPSGDERQYHEYRNGEIRVELELFFGGFENKETEIIDFLNDVILGKTYDGDASAGQTLNDFAERAKELKALLATDNPSSQG